MVLWESKGKILREKYMVLWDNKGDNFKGKSCECLKAP